MIHASLTKQSMMSTNEMFEVHGSNCSTYTQFFCNTLKLLHSIMALRWERILPKPCRVGGCVRGV